MSTGIYAYWDNVNGYYAYVGKDSNICLNRRHNDHQKPSKYDAQPFNRILQNNPDRYEYRIIMEGDYNDWQLNQMGKLCIKSFKTFKYDYPERSVFNFTKGGEGVSGFTHTEESKQKMSEAMKGTTGYWKDKTFSDEMKRKMSESHIGQTLSDEHKQKISESIKGRIFTDEHKENLSRSQNTSGYYRVSKKKSKRVKQGFVWSYNYYVDGKQKTISSVDIKKLEKKVKDKGLCWKKF